MFVINFLFFVILIYFLNNNIRRINADVHFRNEQKIIKGTKILLYEIIGIKKSNFMDCFLGSKEVRAIEKSNL